MAASRRKRVKAMRKVLRNHGAPVPKRGCLGSLALVLVLVLVVSGCQWSADRFHWPRTDPNQTEVVVYFEDHTATYQGWFVWHSAQVWDWADSVQVIYTTQCPAGAHCARWYTGDNQGGLATIWIDGNNHILDAEIVLDDQIVGGPTYEQYAQDVRISCHEAGHALGGGFDDPATFWDEHQNLCTDQWPWAGHPTQENYTSIAAAYAPHDDGGLAVLSILEDETVVVEDWRIMSP